MGPVKNTFVLISIASALCLGADPRPAHGRRHSSISGRESEAKKSHRHIRRNSWVAGPWKISSIGFSANLTKYVSGGVSLNLGTSCACGGGSAGAK